MQVIVTTPPPPPVTSQAKWAALPPPVPPQCTSFPVREARELSSHQQCTLAQSMNQVSVRLEGGNYLTDEGQPRYIYDVSVDNEVKYKSGCDDDVQYQFVDMM